MNYWRLTIRRPIGPDQVIDLRTTRTVYAGDKTNNDVCINTTFIPSRFKIVSQLFGKIFVQLTEETLPSLKGKFEKKKDWHTRLFNGSMMEVKGDMNWKIADAEFFLKHVEHIPVVIAPTLATTLEKKHWYQSFGGAFATHALLLLLILLFSLISGGKNNEIALEDIQKIAIADVKKVFEEPKPEPVKMDSTDTSLVGEAAPNGMAAEADQTISVPVKPSKDLKVAKLKTQIQKGETLKKPGVETMGLLGLQKNTQPKKSNLDVVALASAAGRQSKDKDNHENFGLADASGDLNMMGHPATEQVANLSTSGIQSYQGGLSDKVKSGVKRTASIRLVKREVEVRGGLDPAVIRQIIEERLVEVKYCYENALLSQSSLEGKISASWTIKADGTVSELKSESDEIKQNILHPCINDQIRKWKFPTPKGGGVVHVKYPFLFSPVGS